MPIEATGPSALLDFRSLSSRHSNPAMTVPPEARIGERTSQRGPAGDPSVLLDAEGFAVAGDVEQRVVGRSADDEDEQDALGLPAQQDHLGLGQPPDDEQGDGQREEARREHDDGQQQRTVDQDEYDEHGEQCDAEEEPVDPGERVDEVGGEAGRTGDVDGDPARSVRAEVLAYRRDDFPDVGIRVDRHERLERMTVFRGDQGRDARGHAGEIGQPGNGAPQRFDLILGRLVLADDHDDGRKGIRVAEVGQALLNASGVGGRGKI